MSNESACSTQPENSSFLQALTFPKEFRQYYRNTNGRQTAYHDGILTINTNADFYRRLN
jgi:hypothetical protein